MVARLAKGIAFLNLVILIVLATVILAPQTALAQNFMTVDYPGATLTTVEGINNKGAMAGYYEDAQNVGHGFVLQNGVFTNIDFPNAVDTFAYGINDSGVVVGFYDDSLFASHGFLLSNGVYTTFDHPNSDTVATGINNVGQIVGYYYQASSGKFVGFLLSGGTYSDINVPGSLGTEVFGINNVGAIVGFYLDSGNNPNGFLLQNGTFNTIDYPGAAYTEALGINDGGQIVGRYQTLGFEYNPANPSSPFTTINFPAAVLALGVSDINDAGQLVGWYYDAANVGHGFVSAVGPFAYVGNQGTATVSIIDTPTSLLVTTIPAIYDSSGIAVSPNGKQVYVTNFFNSNGTVSVIDTASSTVVATIPVESFPTSVAFTPPKGTQAYVVNEGSSSVSVIDTASQKVVGTVPVQSNPEGVAMALTSEGVFAYVSGGSTVSVIAVGTNPTVVANIPVGSNSEWIAAAPNSSLVYVANAGSNNISVISVATNTVTATIPVGTFPYSVALTQDGSFAYVVNNGSNSVSVIDTAAQKVVATVPGLNSPYDVELSTDGASAYVANHGGSSVSVIDTASNMITATLPVGSHPFGVAIAQVPQTELQITQPLSPTQPNSFNFGTNTYVAQYPPGTKFSGVTMTLTEVPITQAQFRQFVAGIPKFANAACIVYAGAGGNCIDDQVTCNPSPCPSESLPIIDVQTSFMAPQSVVNPGYLTTPIGQNLWQNIFSGYYAIEQLITVKGRTTGFSEFVAVDLGASNPQGQANLQILSPTFPAIYSQGQVIPISFQLTSVVPPKPAVTDAQASISVVMIADANGNPTQQVVFSKTNAFGQPNPGVYKYSLDATPYAAGAYSVTIYGTAFPSFQGQFTIKVAAGSVVLVAKPTSLTFPNTHVGIFSAALRDSLFNEGSVQGIVSSVQTTGDFQMKTNYCANGVKPATHCDVYIVFSPTDLGTRTGTLSYYDNAPGSPQIVNLSGVGTTTTSTSLTSSLNPSFYGQAITLTAVVVPAVSGTPTGNVTFYDGTTSLGSVALTNGTAALTISTLTGGYHSLTAAYAGGGYFDPSTSPVLSQKVARSPVKVALTSSQNPSHVGQQVTFSATVSGILATPTGSVTFKEGSTVLGTVPLVNGQASWTLTFTKTGTHSIFVRYLGDQNYLPRTSAAVKQVIEN
jgi:YVTN family beta-propeller protein